MTALSVMTQVVIGALAWFALARRTATLFLNLCWECGGACEVLPRLPKARVVRG